ncbi:cytochrome b/b6 domain-containing protein [Gallaecimonas kandeliae]|uniref:cytochrome b/b6 domain-containing protein n=1 Tax=Gallaecimonas kandeliae TaxID=3029055 RepID=UPI0026492981|nr:cytochrome b/b6 domain-containing protein [Gallaecimonas kandeliae]WKE66481.1 cytochrome b/b6 domain-containing protein [Gallaecimonas kandeliae]
MTKVWDGFVRLYHWAQLGLLGGCWWTAEQGDMVWHQWLAMTLMALWGARLYWGFAGSGSARFGQFLKGPRQALAFGRDLFKGRGKGVAGHNPLGGWMVVALLLSLGVQLGTGLFANDEIFTEGPLYGWVSGETSDWLTRLHHLNFNLLLALAAVHVLAVLGHSLRGDRLVPAMVTGRKAGVAEAPRLKAPWPAWLVFAGLWGLLYWGWGSGL